jgi:hypothetical protein
VMSHSPATAALVYAKVVPENVKNRKKWYK